MERGDLISINLRGRDVIFCIVGRYQDQEDGQEILVMALIDPDQIVHIKSNRLGIKGLDNTTMH
ncbi:MAG: hypothetical protein HPY50_17555 [Firmicutes bacterium]|nr:hypothetical protein [Bacillota bacterium]